MAKIESEGVVTVAARIPSKLAEIITEKAKDMRVEFAVLAGDYILKGIESQRRNEENK